jgi:hypothetical protein
MEKLVYYFQVSRHSMTDKEMRMTLTAQGMFSGDSFCQQCKGILRPDYVRKR